MNTHIYDKYSNVQGVWNVIQGATKKKIVNKSYAKTLVCVTYYHFESEFNIILCMRDTEELK